MRSVESCESLLAALSKLSALTRNIYLVRGRHPRVLGNFSTLSSSRYDGSKKKNGQKRKQNEKNVRNHINFASCFSAIAIG